MITLFKISLLLPQIILGLLFSWKAFIMTDFPDGFAGKRSIYCIVFVILPLNLLILTNIFFSLFLSDPKDYLFAWQMGTANYLISLLLTMDIWFVPKPWKYVASKRQRNFLLYTMAFTMTTSFCASVFFTYKDHMEFRAKDQELAQMTDELYRLKNDTNVMKRKFAESEKKKQILLDENAKRSEEIQRIKQEMGPIC